MPPRAPAVQCHARSKRTGKQCTQSAILGGTVCRYHGGAAPQVKAKAEERLRSMVDPALDVLNQILVSGETDSVKLAAVKDVLDRAGFGATAKHEIEVNLTDERMAAVLDVLDGLEAEEAEVVEVLELPPGE